mgnify:CR=1 FL=1
MLLSVTFNVAMRGDWMLTGGSAGREISREEGNNRLASSSLVWRIVCVLVLTLP